MRAKTEIKIILGLTAAAIAYGSTAALGQTTYEIGGAMAKVENL